MDQVNSESQPKKPDYKHLYRTEYEKALLSFTYRPMKTGSYYLRSPGVDEILGREKPSGGGGG